MDIKGRRALLSDWYFSFAYCFIALIRNSCMVTWWHCITLRPASL